MLNVKHSYWSKFDVEIGRTVVNITDMSSRKILTNLQPESHQNSIGRYETSVTRRSHRIGQQQTANVYAEEFNDGFEWKYDVIVNVKE